MVGELLSDTIKVNGMLLTIFDAPRTRDMKLTSTLLFFSLLAFQVNATSPSSEKLVSPKTEPVSNGFRDVDVTYWPLTEDLQVEIHNLNYEIEMAFGPQRPWWDVFALLDIQDNVRISFAPTLRIGREVRAIVNDEGIRLSQTYDDMTINGKVIPHRRFSNFFSNGPRNDLFSSTVEHAVLHGIPIDVKYTSYRTEFGQPAHEGEVVHVALDTTLISEQLKRQKRETEGKVAELNEQNQNELNGQKPLALLGNALIWLALIAGLYFGYVLIRWALRKLMDVAEKISTTSRGIVTELKDTSTKKRALDESSALKQWAELRDQGEITQEEFEKKKADLLR